MYKSWEAYMFHSYLNNFPDPGDFDSNIPSYLSCTALRLKSCKVTKCLNKLFSGAEGFSIRSEFFASYNHRARWLSNFSNIKNDLNFDDCPKVMELSGGMACLATLLTVSSVAICLDLSKLFFFLLKFLVEVSLLRVCWCQVVMFLLFLWSLRKFNWV